MNIFTLGEHGWALESFFGQDYVTAVRLTSSKKEGGSDAQQAASTQTMCKLAKHHYYHRRQTITQIRKKD